VLQISDKAIQVEVKVSRDPFLAATINKISMIELILERSFERFQQS
jgi:hypothetical protein